MSTAWLMAEQNSSPAAGRSGLKGEAQPRGAQRGSGRACPGQLSFAGPSVALSGWWEPSGAQSPPLTVMLTRSSTREPPLTARIPLEDNSGF